MTTISPGGYKCVNPIISCTPGNVGPVGDVNKHIRFAQSNPFLPMRYDPLFTGRRAESNGANINNGTKKSFNSRGGPAKVIKAAWGGRRRMGISHGTRMQYYQPNTTPGEFQGSLGDYTWRLKTGKVYKATHAGKLMLPGGYEPVEGALPRGAKVPTVVSAPSQDEGQSLQVVIGRSGRFGMPTIRQ